MVPANINATVVGVICLITLIYYTTVFLTVLPWLEISVPGMSHCLVLTCTTLAGLYCFVTCVITDPGSVPDKWTPRSEDAPVVEVKKTDHHCPWMNNCIGAHNYRVFILFLLYITAAALHCLTLLCMAAVTQLQQSGLLHHDQTSNKPLLQHSWTSSQIAAQVAVLVLLVPLALALLLLTLWNLFLLLHNKTTIEYQEGVTARVRASRHGATYAHPYDLGAFKNLHAICGPHMFEWLLPHPPGIPGDGMQYQTVWDTHHPNLVTLLPSVEHAGSGTLQTIRSVSV